MELVAKNLPELKSLRLSLRSCEILREMEDQEEESNIYLRLEKLGALEELGLTLDFPSNPGVTASFVRELRHLKNLAVLSLKLSKFEESGDLFSAMPESFGSLEKLREIRVSLKNSKLINQESLQNFDRAIKQLGRLERLEFEMSGLFISMKDGLTNFVDFRAFPVLKHYTKKIFNNNFSYNRLVKCPSLTEEEEKAVPLLETFELFFQNNVNFGFMEEERSTQIMQSEVRHFSRSQCLLHLRTLHFNVPYDVSIYQPFNEGIHQKCPNLEILSVKLSNLQIRDEGLIHMIQQMKESHRLKKLTLVLDYNKISRLIPLVEWMESLSHLQELNINLSSNDLDDKEILIFCLRLNRLLNIEYSEFDFNDNYLSDETFETLKKLQSDRFVIEIHQRKIRQTTNFNRFC